MAGLIQIVGGVVVVFSAFNLFDDKSKDDAKKTWYKIGGGTVLILLGTVLKFLEISF